MFSFAGPTLAVSYVVIGYALSLVYFFHSLARLDAPLVPGTESFWPSYGVFGGMIKSHWHKDAARQY
jgi:hypothetical protein